MPCRFARRFFRGQETPKRGVFFAFSGKYTIAIAIAAVTAMQGNRSRGAAVFALYVTFSSATFQLIEL